MDVPAVVHGVAQVDTHSEAQRAGCERALALDSCCYGALDARKLGKKAVACQFNDLATVFDD